jgi:hypothetical protein
MVPADRPPAWVTIRLEDSRDGTGLEACAKRKRKKGRDFIGRPATEITAIIGRLYQTGIRREVPRVSEDHPRPRLLITRESNRIEQGIWPTPTLDVTGDPNIRVKRHLARTS